MGLQPVGQAQLAELRDRTRREPVAARLVAREDRRIDQDRVEPGPRAPRRGGRAGRAGADDEDVGRGGCRHARILSAATHPLEIRAWHRPVASRARRLPCDRAGPASAPQPGVAGDPRARGRRGCRRCGRRRAQGPAGLPARRPGRAGRRLGLRTRRARPRPALHLPAVRGGADGAAGTPADVARGGAVDRRLGRRARGSRGGRTSRAGTAVARVAGRAGERRGTRPRAGVAEPHVRTDQPGPDAGRPGGPASAGATPVGCRAGHRGRREADAPRVRRAAGAGRAPGRRRSRGAGLRGHRRGRVRGDAGLGGVLDRSADRPEPGRPPGAGAQPVGPRRTDAAAGHPSLALPVARRCRAARRCRGARRGAVWWRRGDRLLGTCLGAVAMLLASPVAWSHHWVWARAGRARAVGAEPVGGRRLDRGVRDPPHPVAPVGRGTRARVGCNGARRRQRLSPRRAGARRLGARRRRTRPSATGSPDIRWNFTPVAQCDWWQSGSFPGYPDSQAWETTKPRPHRSGTGALEH